MIRICLDRFRVVRIIIVHLTFFEFSFEERSLSVDGENLKLEIRVKVSDKA